MIVEATARRTREIKPIIVLDEERVSAVVELLNELNSTPGSDPDLEISVGYRNGDTIELGNVESLINSPNRKSNPIVKVAIGGSFLNKNKARLTLTNNSYSLHGAEVELRGTPQETSEGADKLSSALSIESPMNHILPSMNPVILATLVALFINMIIFKEQVFQVFIRDFYTSGIVFVWVVFCLMMPAMLLFFFFWTVQHRFIGRFVLYWGDARNRFDKATAIFNYALFSLPVILIINIFLGSS